MSWKVSSWGKWVNLRPWEREASGRETKEEADTNRGFPLCTYPTYLVCITLLLAVLTVILVVSTQDLWLNKLCKSLLLHTVITYRHTHIQPAPDI